jgi:hypothetical protein
MCKLKTILNYSLFLGIVLAAFAGCSDERLDSSLTRSLVQFEDPTDLTKCEIEDICKSSKADFELVNQCMLNCLSSGYSEDTLSLYECQQLEDALNLYSRTDIETVLDNYGVDKSIYDACTFYVENSEKDDVFDLLLEKYPNFTNDDWKMVFYMYYCGMLINDNITVTRAISLSCAVSVGGALISCFSAAGIGGVVGLGWWLATYSASLVGVVASCI